MKVTKAYRGLTADARALSAYVKLIRAGESVLREATRPLALYDLTASQFGVLEALHQRGPQSPDKLARGIAKTGGNLAQAVRMLERRGLVGKASGRRERNVARIRLTPKGRRLVQTILPGHAASIVGVMGRLSPREQEILGALCGKLGGAAGRERRRIVGKRGD